MGGIVFAGGSFTSFLLVVLLVLVLVWTWNWGGIGWEGVWIMAEDWEGLGVMSIEYIWTSFLRNFFRREWKCDRDCEGGGEEWHDPSHGLNSYSS